MPDIEIHIDIEGETRYVGLGRLNKVRGNETITFEYADAWLADPDSFSIDPRGKRLLSAWLTRPA